MPRCPWILGTCLAAVLLLFVTNWGILFFFPWTAFNCWHENIDITCGRYRYQRYLFGLKIVDRVDETPISKLYRKVVGEPSSPVWRRVNTFSPGYHHSPHYVHHGALSAVGCLERAFETAEFSDEAKRIVLTNFFQLLMTDDRDDRAKDYAWKVESFALDQSGRGSTRIDVGQVQDLSDGL